MSLKYEPTSEPLHIYVTQLFSNSKWCGAGVVNKAAKGVKGLRDGEYGVTRGIDFKNVDTVHPYTLNPES